MFKLEKPDKDYLVLERDSSLYSKWRKWVWEGFPLNTPPKFSVMYGQSIDKNCDSWNMDRSIRDDLDQWDAHIQKLNVMYRLYSNVIKVCQGKKKK
jgi:hypothetical protein